MGRVFGGGLTSRLGRWAALLLGAAVCGVVVASCGDQPTAAVAHHLRPGNASLSITPSFAPLPPGAPNIQLSKINGVLIGPTGDSILVTAKFDGDSAILVFDIEVTGNSADFTLRLTAFDMNGIVAYQSTQLVTVKPGDNTGLPAPVLVYAAPDAKIQSLHVRPSGVVLNAGESASLSATGTGADGQTIPPLRLGWTSHDESVATVDDNGNVRAGAFQGSTWIVARTANNIADSATVNVHAAVDHVSVSAATLEIVHGASSSVTAQLLDAGNHVIDDRSAVWSSSDPSVATVSSSGSVQGIKVGTATLTASAEGKSATVAVSVVSAVDHIDLTPASLTFATLGQSQSVSAHVVARAGASVDGIVASFSSSNPFIATVSSDGKVTAMSDGSATITASADGVTATTSVTVKQVPASITVSPSSGSVTALGDAFDFKATAYDAGGNAMPSAVVTWSTSDSKVASIDSDGRVIAGKVGDATITATDGPVSGSASFTASQTPAKLTVTSDKSTFMVTQTATLTAHELDANDNSITEFNPVWSTTTPSVASVTADGVVTGLAVGTAHVVATADGLKAAMDLSVTSLPAVTLTLSPSSATMFPSDTKQFSATSSGATGTITWSVRDLGSGNATVGTVNTTTGLYTAPTTVPSPDTVSVCATQASPPGHSCATVTIKSATVTLSLNVPSIEKLPGGTQSFTVSGGTGPYTWKVNDVTNGNTTFGTISASGSTATYTAPSAVPTPSRFNICVSQAGPPTGSVCASATIDPIPTSGGEVVVFNDENMFDDTYGSPYANDIQFYKNLVEFTADGVRAAKTGVLMDRSHNSVCGATECSEGSQSVFRSTLTNAGFTITDIDNTSATITSIPATIKAVFLWMPTVSYSVAEINALKAFASEGGRIIFVGEREGYYGDHGINVENNFFSRMGAQMTNQGGNVDCGHVDLPASSLRSHQITTGLTGLAIACASEVIPGPNDYPLFYDVTGTKVLGAVAKVDLTPLSNETDRAPQTVRRMPAPSPLTVVAPGAQPNGWSTTPSRPPE